MTQEPDVRRTGAVVVLVVGGGGGGGWRDSRQQLALFFSSGTARYQVDWRNKTSLARRRPGITVQGNCSPRSTR